MQGAQKGVQYDDDTQFEIADFRSTLNKCIEDQDQTYGRKNKPREQDPSMFQLLSWEDKEKAQWDYTKRDQNVVEANVANQLKYRINKSNSNWVTENMDQFRKFTYSPSKKAVFFDIEEPTKTGKHSPQKSEYAHSLGKSPKDKGVYVKELPKNAPETLDKYAIKDIKNLRDVLKVIENRAIDKGGDLIPNPIAGQLTDHYGYDEEADYYENGEVRARGTDEEGDGQQDSDEDSEDVKVDKANYTNVQSRLLTNKVRKAKELDPVYEKDRLKRREDRIQRLNETTRWLPNSAFKTYFGKPPFENYGRGNVNPTVGGPIYGDYMKSHNINPHAGDNKPEYKQIFDRAELAATTYPANEPEPPRKCKDDFRLSQNQVEELKKRNPRVPEKFSVTSKKIIKPDLVNSLRFASEENTPEGSVDEKEKSSKPKNLAEAFKNLSKTTKAIRKDLAKNSPTKSKSSKKDKRSKSKNKKQELLYRQLQDQLKSDREKAAAAKKEAKESPAPAPAKQETIKKAQPQSETKQTKTQSRTEPKQKQSKPQAREERDEDVEYSRGARPATAQTQQSLRGKSNDSKSVRDLMNDPATAFTDARSPNKKEVSFKQGQDAKSAGKYKEASQVQPRESHHDYGKVEHLSTLLRESQKNDKLWNKIHEDMDGTHNVDPMNPPKNYLFNLAPKETDPRYYKNVPAVWTKRIPYAGKKIEKAEDIKGVFNYCD